MSIARSAAKMAKVCRTLICVLFLVIQTVLPTRRARACPSPGLGLEQDFQDFQDFQD